MVNQKPENPEQDLVQAGLLLDIYGGLLTKRQRDFLSLHYEQDLSFSEIAREYQISRQAVHDSVKHGLRALRRFEEALGLLARSEREAEERQGTRSVAERLSALRDGIAQGGDSLDRSALLSELEDLLRLTQGGDGTRREDVEPHV